tara:strand:+ start:76 stop:540 length:465 start_codon:yes stop_codon:yes gene_type:complete
MSREDNEQIRPKKETGLRHPIGKPDYKERKFRKRIEPKEEKTETSNTNKPKAPSGNFEKKAKEISKKLLKFTPIGNVTSLIDTYKDITKKDKGIKVNKGDQKSFKVNTGKNLGAGSSNPRKFGAKSGGSSGRAMLKGGGICKKGMNRKAIGKNS